MAQCPSVNLYLLETSTCAGMQPMCLNALKWQLQSLRWLQKERRLHGEPHDNYHPESMFHLRHPTSARLLCMLHAVLRGLHGASKGALCGPRRTCFPVAQTLMQLQTCVSTEAAVPEVSPAR